MGLTDETALTNDEIKELYIKWRCEPANLQHRDLVFCSLHGVSIDKLRKITRDPDVIKEIEGREVTDVELSTLLGLLTRLCYEKAFQGRAPVKSLEGLTQAIVALMKQRQLEGGRPTEILEIKEKELLEMKPADRYQKLMSYLRRPSN